MRLALIGLLLAACGGSTALATAAPGIAAPATASAAVASVPTATSTVTSGSASTIAPTSTAAAAGASWVVGVGSKAVVSVREQLVGVSLPSDAVLTATGGAGTFALSADGTFRAGSKISFDLTTLASDNTNRDSFVKQSTLQTRLFPKAEFVPTRTNGLALPLAQSGTFSFALTGALTVHGTTKEVTFDVVAMRSGAELTATATARPTLKFSDFGMTAPSVPFRVVSIVDEIRLVIQLVATSASS